LKTSEKGEEDMRILFVMTLLLMSGCGYYEPKQTDGFTVGAQKVIFGRCVGCHAGGNSEQGFGYIDKPDLLIANGYIVPGSAETSKLYLKTSTTPPFGARMPFGGPYLYDDERAALAEWINNISTDSGGGPAEVTITGTGLTIAEDSTQTVDTGSTISLSLTVRAGDALTGSLTKNVEGTCPKGSFSGTTYTTGPITASCTVKLFADNPCSEIISGVTFNDDIKDIISSGIGGGSVQCTNCHFADQGLPVYAPTSGADATYSLVMGNDVIEAADPRGSKFYVKTTPDASGGRMPASGAPYLVDNKQAKICNWILDGAPES
jgi:hypothetical protein